MTTRKYLQGLAAFERRIGVSLPSLSGGTLTRRAVGADPLTDDGNVRWYGTISVGSPAVQYKGEPLIHVVIQYLIHIIQWILILVLRTYSFLRQTVIQLAMDIRAITQAQALQLSICIKTFPLYMAMALRSLANCIQTRSPLRVS